MNKIRKSTTAVLSLIFAVVLLLPLIQTLIVTAATVHDVTIIQVAWMGNVNSANDEWLQLHNNSGSAVDLAGMDTQLCRRHADYQSQWCYSCR